MHGSRLHAFLIGIDHYSHQGGPALGLYPDLTGAVLDVGRWADFLVRHGVHESHLVRLTAPLTDSHTPFPLPTYEQIVDGLQSLEARTCPGDGLLFVFMGHGGCVPTCVPEIKGEDGVDQVLVPANPCGPEARLLRDVELVVLIDRWKRRGLQVTLCIDCCHSGAAVRSGIRGSGLVDSTRRPARSRLADHEELVACWEGLVPASGWLPNPQGYVLFAACLAHERAYEGHFDSRGPGGAMTRALLQALETEPSSVTCRQLHERASETVQRWTEGQTPQVEGDLDRPFWPSKDREPVPVEGTESSVVEVLKRGDPGYYLTGQLRLALYLPPPDFDPRQRDVAALRRYVEAQEPVRTSCRDGEWVCLKVENRSLQPLLVALYARLPDAAPTQFYPASGVGKADLLRSGEWDLLPMQPRLPPGARAALNKIEGIATNEMRFFDGDYATGVFWTVVTLNVSVVSR